MRFSILLSCLLGALISTSASLRTSDHPVRWDEEVSDKSKPSLTSRAEVWATSPELKTDVVDNIPAVDLEPNSIATDTIPDPLRDSTIIYGIPKALKISREGRLPATPLVRQFLMSDLATDTSKAIFQAPPCLEGQYYTGFQLFYDLGDPGSDSTAWAALLQLTLFHGEDSLWTKPLRVDAMGQTFIATAFYDSLISCDDDYYVVVTQKQVEGGAPQDNIYLKLLLYKKADEVFDPAAEIFLSTSGTAQDMTTVSWSFSGEGAIEYDLEWVSIADHENFTDTAASSAFRFKEPVRITTAAQYYDYLSFYPKGRVWHRVRAVGYNPEYPDHRIPGHWFYTGPDSVDNLEPGKNWQVQTVFAEEGKYKKVVHYFDGSLRERQVQTNLNSSGITLVGETMYDFEGRKSVDVLPVPATDLSQSLTYRNTFNKFAALDDSVEEGTSPERIKFNYDNHRLENSVLTNDDGAGWYYSSANTGSAIHNALIPESEGYAFSQTEYLRDGTGRVSRQSGVGKEFAQDGAHATRYYYGNATQEELVRLFGSNVGHASHYKKNLVVDPNGQVSISYHDQEDRVIATALGGEKPDNVAALESYVTLDTTAIIVNITNKNERVNGVSTTAHKLLNVAPNTNYTFQYDLLSYASQIENFGCEECSFDLRITLTDPDGELMDLSFASGNQSVDGLSYEYRNITADSCADPTQVNVVFDVLLEEIGDYTITKSLVPHELTFAEMGDIVKQSSQVQAKMDVIRNSYELDSAQCEICTSGCEGAEAIINETINEIAALDCENIRNNIIQKLRDQYPDSVEYEPSQAEISADSLYCKYELCVKDQKSDAFEKQMARIADWDAAVAAGYANPSNLVNNLDPFFADAELSGYNSRSDMLDNLNSIHVATIQGFDIIEPILGATDPANVFFYTDSYGNPVTEGYHILYFDLMSRREEQGEVAYQTELKIQRWNLYKSFYLEAKRKIKLGIQEYQECPKAMEELEITDNLPSTEQEMIDFGIANGVGGPATDEEVGMSFYSIQHQCDTLISPADSATIAGRLEAYFNNDPANLYKLIYTHRLGVDEDLIAIQNVLTPYGCGLENVAQIDPLTCAKDTTVLINIPDQNQLLLQRAALTAEKPEKHGKMRLSREEIKERQAKWIKAARHRRDSLAGLLAHQPVVDNRKAHALNDEQENARKEMWSDLQGVLREERASKIRRVDFVGDEARLLIQPDSAVVTHSLLSVCVPNLQDEYDALMALYNATNGVAWTNDTGWGDPFPASVGNWYGVDADANGHVISILLPSNGLEGTLPAQLGDLCMLEHLDLSDNTLSGSIPEEISSLVNLEILDLTSNGLTGEIPTEIGDLVNLQELYLGENELEGAVPFQIENLINLSILDLHENQFYSLSFGIEELVNLTALFIHDNQLGGSIPSWLGDLSNLQYLIMDHNQFRGPIPSSLGNLSNLEILSLSYNDITEATIPSALGDMTNLRQLLLDHNSLTGSVPAELADLSNLEVLWINDAGLSGVLPAGIATLPSLNSLQIENNEFTFSDFLDIESAYAGTTFTYAPQGLVEEKENHVVFPGTSFTFTANVDRTTSPASVYQWFKDSVAITTQSTGSHSVAISSVSESDAGFYYYTITNPAAPDLTLTSETQRLIVSDCEWSPQADYNALMALFNATNGSQWYDNDGWGESYPADLSGWEGVYINNDGKVEGLDLRDNNLEGILPAALSDLCALEYIDLSENLLTGTMEPLVGLVHLESIDLNYNELTGEIPAAMGNLYQLQTLDLSLNYLSGRIPPELGYTPVEDLILSGNSLVGSIPATFARGPETFLIMDLAFNFLSERIPPEVVQPFYTQGDISGNSFTFSDILDALANHAGEGSLMADNQAWVDFGRVIELEAGQPITFVANVDRDTDHPSEYQWFKFVDGMNDIPLTSQHKDNHTYTILSADASDIGMYYYTIVNDDPRVWWGSWPLVLQSNMQEVTDQPIGEPHNICLEYDTTNATLQKFTFTVDWNQVVQQCLENAAKEDSVLINYAIEKLIEEEVTSYYNNYSTQCLDGAAEDLAYSYVPKEYHYTLYYFDQAGNLAQTVPPQGVTPLTGEQVTDFLAGHKTEPAHTMRTRYQYNSLNQLVWQRTPDAGESRFWYNNKSQLRLSQNAQQLKDSSYSYTRYDEQGRIVEVGEMNTAIPLVTLEDSLELLSFPRPQDYVLADITRTHYDFAKSGLQEDFSQTFLRNRVAYVEVMERNQSDTIATFYSYDIHGNVRSLLQQLPGLGYKRTDYVYDLVSGKVNYVMYQYDEDDALIHRYQYDSDNRLTDVYTSTDGFIWDKDAGYEYYLHGPLARQETGEYRLQGLDYYYTLQGWIKGVNGIAVDPGGDGSGVVPVDVFGYNLGYYEGDYTAAGLGGASEMFHLPMQAYTDLMGNQGLYNGNIAWMATNLAKIGEIKADPLQGTQAMLYQYDQLHRITQSRSLTQRDENGGFVSRATDPQAYDEDYTYDANGNLLTLQRLDENAVLKDDFTYGYYTGTNKLRQLVPVERDTVYDGGAVTSNHKVYRNITIQGTSYVAAGSDVVLKATENIDITDNFDVADDANFHAYVLPDEEGVFLYDAIGNLVWDQEEGVKIIWTPYGKVREVVKGDTTTTSFRYDGAGNRVEKKVVRPDKTLITRYVRDASGNVMAIYNDTLLSEQPIYGSSRLGLYRGGRIAGHRTMGYKNYEFSNHLGNVLTVITDNVYKSEDSVWTSIVSASDYYPFGLEMEGRSYRDSTYRYGFNGKEKDDSGEWGDTHYDYGFRIYNPSIGKFLSVDPLTKSYPWYTPYQFAGNKPIWAIDVDGLEEFIKTYRYEDGRATLISVINNARVQVEFKSSTERNGQTPFTIIKIDKRTGKPMEPNEIGQVQHQYYDNDGNRLPVRRDFSGDYVSGDNEMMSLGNDNLFGSIYIGGNNPTYIDNEGYEQPDYRREPQDAADVLALAHDKRYDVVKAAGAGDAFYDRSFPVKLADQKLVEGANDIVQGAKGGAIDPVTGRALNNETIRRAKGIKAFFGYILKAPAFKGEASSDPRESGGHVIK